MAEIKERPILFSSQMVRAILAGKKTMTRRVVKEIPTYLHLGRPIMEWGLSQIYQMDDERWWLDVQTDVDDNSTEELVCPFGFPGDRLWVRETFAQIPAGRPAGYFTNRDLFGKNYWYRATDSMPTWGGKWKPSIFMPKEASRITLEITSISIERLQEITEEDAIAEGCQCPGVPASLTNRGSFAKLWDSINAKRGVCKTCKGHGVVLAWSGSVEGGSLARDAKDCPDCHGAESGFGWDANPWVWVVEFNRC